MANNLSGKQLISIILTSLIVAGLLTYLVTRSYYTGDYKYHGISYNKEAPGFELDDHKGSKTRLADLEGNYILLTFGYTHCPDVCPTTLSELNKTVKQLGSKKENVRVVFITVDPERDTQKRLKEYIPFFNKNFLGLTGNENTISKVAESYSIFYEKEFSTSRAKYFIDHTPSVFLIDKGGKLSLIYPYNRIDPDLIAKDIRHLEKSGSKEY